MAINLNNTIVMPKKLVKEIVKQAKEEREDELLDMKILYPKLESEIEKELKESKKKVIALDKRIKEKEKLSELRQYYTMEFVHPYDNYDKAELEWFLKLRPYEMLKFMKTEPEKYKRLHGIMARKGEMATASELLRRETENYINQLNKERKTVKLKSLPKGLDELLEVTDKPIRLRKTIKLKSDKKISQDIDKLLKEVDAIVKKQKKGALTITQVRSEIFNRVLKEADKQHNADVNSSESSDFENKKENTKLTDIYAEKLNKKEKDRQSDTIKKSLENSRKKKALLAKLKTLREAEYSSSESEN